LKANQVPTVICQSWVLSQRIKRPEVKRTLANECARGHNPKPNPQPVYDTAEEGYYFVSKQRRERDDDEDSNRDQPAGGEVSDLLRPGTEGLSGATASSAPVSARDKKEERAHSDDLVVLDGHDDGQHDGDDGEDPARYSSIQSASAPAKPTPTKPAAHTEILGRQKQPLPIHRLVIRLDIAPPSAARGHLNPRIPLPHPWRPLFPPKYRHRALAAAAQKVVLLETRPSSGRGVVCRGSQDASQENEGKPVSFPGTGGTSLNK
jgi:hypothetical protein